MDHNNLCEYNTQTKPLSSSRFEELNGTERKPQSPIESSHQGHKDDEFNVENEELPGHIECTA